MEYKGYKLTVNKKTNREMWFKDGRLVKKTEVPEGVKAFLRNPKEKALPKTDVSKLHGFKEGEVITSAEAKEKAEQEGLALTALNERFPEFTFKVEYKPMVIRNKVPIGPVYKIFVFVGDRLEKIMSTKEFDMNVLSQNLEAILSGWKGERSNFVVKRGMRVEEIDNRINASLEHGESETIHVRNVTIPK